MKKLYAGLFLGMVLSFVTTLSAGKVCAQAISSKPAVEVANAPSMGPGDAPVTIVEFSDFECPFCKKFHDQTLTKILEKYRGKIRFAYKHFPLHEVHPHAMNAAKASSCAYFLGEENGFFKYYNILFDRMNEWKKDESKFVAYAQELGMDGTPFLGCTKSPATERWVNNDIEEGKKLGVEKVPTCFVNANKVTGAQPFELFVKMIDEELNKP
jgi:protein-disulfide isomerase